MENYNLRIGILACLMRIVLITISVFNVKYKIIFNIEYSNLNTFFSNEFKYLVLN